MMAFDRPPPPPTDRPQGRRPPALSAPDDGPVTRRELEAFKRQVLQDVRDELEGLTAGIESRVRAAVDATIATAIEKELLRYPGLGKLEQIARDAEASRAAAEEAGRYRIERDTREKIEKELAAKEAAKLALDKQRAEVEQIGATTQNIRTESGTRYRIALLTFIGGVIAVLGTLFGAMVGSRK